MSSLFNSTLFRCVFLIAIVFAAYWPMLNAPFRTIDDRFSIVDNPLIRSFEHIPQIFKQGYFNDQSYYRPLVNVSFMIEYHFIGLNSFFYNLNNVLLHGINAVLVLFLVQLLTGNAWAAFLAALLFAIHPVQWEAVCNVPGRSILMSAFFTLASFIAFVIFEQRGKWGHLVLSVVFFALGLLCKESTGVLPGVIAFYLLWRHGRNVAGKIGLLVPFAIVIVAYIVLRKSLGIVNVHQTTDLQTYLLGFVTFLRSAITHLRLFLFPMDVHYDRALAFFTSFQQPQAGVALMFWSAVLIALYQWRKKISMFVFFLIAWFSIELFPVSQLVASVGTQQGMISTAEHFLYVASIPVFILAAIGWEKLKEINARRPFIKLFYLRAIFTAFLNFFFLISLEQAIYARQELAMLRRSLEYQPNNARVQSSMAMQYVFREDFVKAEEHFRKAVDNDPFNLRYRISLGTSICHQGRWIECLGQYMALDEPKPNVDLDLQIKKAMDKIDEELASGKDYDAKGWFTLGVYYAKKGRVEDSIAAFEKAKAKDPQMKAVQKNLDELYKAREH